MMLFSTCQLERTKWEKLLCPILPLQPGLLSQGRDTFLTIGAALLFAETRAPFLSYSLVLSADSKIPICFCVLI